MPEKTRYNDEELEEFKQIILDKLAIAKSDYEKLLAELSNSTGNGVEDTSPTLQSIEDGSEAQTKAQLMQMAARTHKFIQGLNGALLRIQNKTYGICRETGRLIPKERLRAVPHATLCIEVKNDKRRNH